MLSYLTSNRDFIATERKKVQNAILKLLTDAKVRTEEYLNKDKLQYALFHDSTMFQALSLQEHNIHYKSLSNCVQEYHEPL